MGTHPYHQGSGAASASGSATPAITADKPRVPRPLRWLVSSLLVYIVVLLALPIQMSLDQDALAASIKETDPSLDPAHMDFAIAATLVYSWGLHLAVVALVIWFVAKALRGRQWARIALTIYLVAAIPLSFISVAAGTMFAWAAITGDVLQVLMVVLLWAPRSVRKFFGRSAAGGPRNTNRAADQAGT